MADREKESSEKKSSEKPVIPRGATEIQKMKLEKLMKDPVCCVLMQSLKNSGLVES